MTDYIRKAVELADGFDISNNNCIWLPTGKVTATTSQQWMLDALAAQLVRQVDAMDGYWVTVRPDRTRVMAELISGIFEEAEGPDRTDNTIKAIVDSKVLE